MNRLKEFISLIKEHETFPKNELRDYYLQPAFELLEKYPHIVEDSAEDKTAMFAIVEQQVKRNNHSIRQIHLDRLAMEVAMLTPAHVLNFQNSDGNTVIHITTDMYCYSVSVLDVLKEMGANFSLINKNGETPLIRIASTDSLDDLKFIHGYTKARLLNHRDIVTGSTALMKAIKARKIANIFFLLESGSSLFIRDNEGFNVFDLINDEDYKIKSDRIFYKELCKFVDLFAQKQKAEEDIKSLFS